MEEKLLELFKVANTLSNTQDELFAEITYTADDTMKIQIDIRRKQSYKYVEKCEVSLINNPVPKLDAIINIFNDYVGGASK